MNPTIPLFLILSTVFTATGACRDASPRSAPDPTYERSRRRHFTALWTKQVKELGTGFTRPKAQLRVTPPSSTRSLNRRCRFFS